MSLSPCYGRFRVRAEDGVVRKSSLCRVHSALARGPERSAFRQGDLGDCGSHMSRKSWAYSRAIFFNNMNKTCDRRSGLDSNVTYSQT